MATRQAQIVINVDDKSLVELNAEIKTLENSIKNLKVGTTEWVQQNEKLGKLKTQFNQATDEAKRLQNVIKATNVTTSDQIRSIAKLGAGLVGTFSTISGSLKLIGVNSEAFDEMTAKATTLMSIMGGLNQIAETFSSTNLKGLKNVGAGFKTLVTTVKGASTAMKAALISTGIGALIAGLGLVIANWDKIKGAIGGTAKKEKEANENFIKDSDENVKALNEINKALEERNRLTEEYRKYGIYEQNITQETLKTRNATLSQEIAGKQAELKAAQNAVDEAQKNLDKVYGNRSPFKLEPPTILQDGKLVPNPRLEKELQAAGRQLIIAQNLQELKQQELENLKKQLELNNDILDKRKLQESLARETVDSAEKIIKANEARIVILNTERDRENEIFELQRSSLYQQIISLEKIGTYIDENGKKTIVLTEEEKAQIELLKAQIIALENQNDLYNDQVKKAREKYELDLKNLKIQHEFNMAIADLEIKYIAINEENKKRADSFERILSIIDNEIYQITEEQKLYETILKNRKEINEVEKTTYKQIVDRLKTQLSFYVELQNKNKERLEFEKRILENSQNISETKKKELEDSADILRKQLKANEDSIIESVSKLSKIAGDPYLSIAEKQSQTLEIQGEINDKQLKSKEITASILNTNNEIADKTNEIEKSKIQIEKANAEIYIIEENIRVETEKTTKEIEKQEKDLYKLKNWLKEYSKEIDVVNQIIGQSMELLATGFDNAAIRAQERIDELSKELNDLMKLEEEHQNQLNAYNEELKDANGERYNELLGLIDQESQAVQNAKQLEIEKNNEIKAQDEKRKDAEIAAARWRKAQAITDAIIQTALAVVEALPNVFLAVATGVLGAASIATIAAQKIQVYSEGGFTKRDRSNKTPAGIVHANEYVVPARVVQSSSAQKHIAALERQRVRGYQDGGYVAPNIGTNMDSMIDYDRMTQSFLAAVSQLPNPQVGLVNISQGLREVELTKYQSGLAR